VRPAPEALELAGRIAANAPLALVASTAPGWSPDEAGRHDENTAPLREARDVLERAFDLTEPLPGP